MASADIRGSHGCIGDWWPVQPWMRPEGKAVAYQGKPADRVIRSTSPHAPALAEPSPRLHTARKNLGIATRPFASDAMRIMASRSDASPVARSPRGQENWPPREHHHHFGSHNPDAFYEPPPQHASFSPRSAMAVASTPWNANTSPPLTGASQLPSPRVNGDVHGRLVAKARVKTYMATRPRQATPPYMRHQRAWRDDRVGAPGYIGPSLERFDK